MFISINFLGRDVDKDHEDCYRLMYILEDTDFTFRLNVPIEKHIYDGRGDASVIPSGLVCIYEKYKQNVPKNVALFYKNMIGSMPIAEQNKLLYTDRMWTDAYFPSLEYSKKYFQCVLNQMKILNYTGVMRHEKLVARTIL